MMRMLFVATLAALAASAASGLTEDRVLLVWNSENAESSAVRNAYVAARPGVLELDLDHPNLGPGELTRNQYINRIETPLRAYLDGVDSAGTPLSERVIAIATTRGLPARVAGAGEFTFASERASIESEMSLVYQDLTGAGGGSLPFRYDGLIKNPYHMSIDETIVPFDRSSITVARNFQRTTLNGFSFWIPQGLTPGDIYLVCRLDAGSLQGTLDLIERSASLTVRFGCTQALFDEYSASARSQLDDQGLGSVFPALEDFERAATHLEGLNVAVDHDESFNFVTASELSFTGPLLVLGTYGENHDLDGAGADPPGDGTYLAEYAPHPAGVASSYESFSGNCLVNGTRRQNQACITDWIESGGSFAMATVAEPFAFTVADLDYLVRNLYPRANVGTQGLTFAEAAYSAMPALSWANVPIGDPLARVTVVAPGAPADLSGDGRVDATDLAVLLAAWGTSAGDIDGDGVAGAGDLASLIAAWGPAPDCP